jgi:3-hydroxymyristoyl/3-hydroxydecanoyl-(acyl carrier protein) dehydratase
MDEPYRAFSFVDRITSVRAGVRVRGRYAIPAGIDAFPPSLVAEAIGQLAAWSAMAAVDFQRRPVAGIAGRIELLSPVRPGQTLELAADLDTADVDAIGYGGSAFADGVAVIRLTNCVGPMVSMEDFDAPAAIRKRFDLLCGEGAKPGCFAGLPAFPIHRTAGEFGKVARATLQVPASARIFADHFPARPVFPGSLLMHANLQLAASLANESSRPRAGSAWQPRIISDMKLRAFISPGEELDLEAQIEEASEDALELGVETRKGKRLVGSARVRFTPERQP